MKQEEINEYIEAAEKLGWSMKVEMNDSQDIGSKYLATLQMYTSFGQDVNFELNFNDDDSLYKELKSIYDGYDPSYEASLWLDDTGHGKNGAPYRMCDVYADMVEVEHALGDLMISFYNI